VRERKAGEPAKIAVTFSIHVTLEKVKLQDGRRCYHVEVYRAPALGVVSLGEWCTKEEEARKFILEALKEYLDDVFNDYIPLIEKRQLEIALSSAGTGAR